MSFTSDIKNELIRLVPKSTCCRRALADGLAFCAETVDGISTVSIGSGGADVAAFAAKMLRERLNTDIRCVKTGRTSRLSFKAAVNDDDLEPHVRCQNCETCFLRGVFLAAATVSNPRASSYHAELSIPDAGRARTVYRILSEHGCTPKIINRTSGTGLYFKSGEAIEELLVLLGANSAAFELMNCKIERTIRNEENRATNCVASNILKTVDASRKQIDDIETLAAAGRLETMPFDIRITAKLRLENPEASLAELALLHKPPISKSGLNHRLEKISEEAQKISYQ